MDPDSMDLDPDSMDPKPYPLNLGALLRIRIVWIRIRRVSGSSIFRQCGSGSRTSHRRNLHPSATLQNLNYLHFCGPVWPSWIRIRIPNADSDPADQNECGSVRIWIRIQIQILNTAREAWFCILNNLPGTSTF